MARHVGDLEETCLEKDYSAIFGENYVGVLEETFCAFGENRLEILEIWRTLFGEIVFGDFGENRLAILEIMMEYRSAW